MSTISLKGLTQKRLRINIWTRYRSFGEDLKLVKQNGVWLAAFKLTESPSRIKAGTEPKEKVILLEKPKDFPLDKYGNIEW